MVLARTFFLALASFVKPQPLKNLPSLTQFSYNSAVYASLSSNSYSAFSVSQSFINEDFHFPCPDANNSYCKQWNTLGNKPSILQTLKAKEKAGSLLRLEPLECIQQYAQIIQSKRRNVLLVADDKYFPAAENSTLWQGSRVYAISGFSAKAIYGPQDAARAYDWICPSDVICTHKVDGSVSSTTCSQNSVCSERIDDVISSPETWSAGYGGRFRSLNESATPTYMIPDFHVGYCLSESGEPHCKLHFEPSIAITVTVLNMLKAILMFFIAFGIKDRPLLTIGDAVTSFLSIKDSYTGNMCLVSSKDIKRCKSSSRNPMKWREENYRWKDTLSRKRRIVTLIM
jgi:hypothetical protein